MALTRQAIESMRRMVDSWGQTSHHRQALAPFLRDVQAYFDAEDDRTTRPIPAAVIADARALGEALAGAGIIGEVAEIGAAAGDETKARYRIVVWEEDGAEPLRLEGTVALLTALLGRMGR